MFTFLTSLFVFWLRLLIVFLCLAISLYRKGIRTIESFAASGLIVWVIWIFFPLRIYVFASWGSIIKFPYALFEVIFTYIITARHNFSAVADIFSFTSHRYDVISSSGCLAFVHLRLAVYRLAFVHWRLVVYLSLVIYLSLVVYLSLVSWSQIFITLALIYIFVALTNVLIVWDHIFIATVQVAITAIRVFITLA